MKLEMGALFEGLPPEIYGLVEPPGSFEHPAGTLVRAPLESRLRPDGSGCIGYHVVDAGQDGSLVVLTDLTVPVDGFDIASAAEELRQLVEGQSPLFLPATRASLPYITRRCRGFADWDAPSRLIASALSEGGYIEMNESMTVVLDSHGQVTWEAKCYPPGGYLCHGGEYCHHGSDSAHYVEPGEDPIE